MDTKTLMLLGGGGVALYLLTNNNAATTTTPTVTNPQGLVGINSGLPGGNGSYDTVANYSDLLAAVPNLGNPNYQMTPAELNQYLANYLDLRQGLATWSGGLSPHNIQYHWTNGGCAQKRIFLPLQPPSMAAFVPPPPSSGSSWTSWIGPVLQVAGTVVEAVAGVDNPKYDLTAGEIEVLITGAAILKDILPFYEMNQSTRVEMATNRLNSLLSDYV
jgi:hypothetical protein